jgi:AraC-like DNA-binding protein
MRDSTTEAMVRVMEALRLHRGQFTETQAAQLVGISTSWFRHGFKRHMRVSFRTARLQAKLTHGAHLLTTTRLTISDIAYLLGYSDRTKFEKSFKRLRGLTPVVYRQTVVEIAWPATQTEKKLPTVRP